MNLRTPFLPGIPPLLQGRAPRPFKEQLEQQVKRFEALSFAGLQKLFGPWIPSELFEGAQGDSKLRRRHYWSDLTFWAFLCQVLDPGCACREIVRKIQHWHCEHQLPMPSSRTGAYCQARKRLSLGLLQRIWSHTTQSLGSESATTGVWAGHRLLVADGTGVSMPDTRSNQKAYPQPTTQKPGCGFPVMKLLGIYSLHSGALLHWVEGNLHEHECRLFQRVSNLFKPGDILVGDRAYGGYAQIAVMHQKGVEVVARIHQSRKVDWRKGVSLGEYDRLIEWKRPSNKGKVMSKEEWKELPKTMTLRVVKVAVKTPGFRVKLLKLVTTLIDAERYPAEALADLYRQRWQVEVYIREIKQSLSLDILRCQSPEMIQKEMCMHAIAYNLIRALMNDISREHSVSLGKISFKGTLDAVRRWREQFSQRRQMSKKAEKEARETLYLAIVQDLLPERPDRSEPRVVKRRKKGFRLMTKPRHKMKVEVSRRQK